MKAACAESGLTLDEEYRTHERRIPKTPRKVADTAPSSQNGHAAATDYLQRKFEKQT